MERQNRLKVQLKVVVFFHLRL